MPKISLPDDLKGLVLVASVSGGKDSTALLLALREAGLSFRAVFSDTGWEAPETYEYLDLLRERIGPIDTVRPKRDMIESIKHRAGFPSGMARWCTQELKLDPLRAYHDAIAEETVNVVGVRSSESEARSKLAELEDDDRWGGWVWRPLLRWSVEEVIEIHRHHGIPMNPLYHQGFDRVGCFPCIFSRKEEIRILPEWRIAEIEKLEREASEERTKRKLEDPDRYSSGVATFFKSRVQGQSPGIREIVSWSRTSRGGRQLDLLASLPQGGCMRWGMCEAPTQSKEAESASPEGHLLDVDARRPA